MLCTPPYSVFTPQKGVKFFLKKTISMPCPVEVGGGYNVFVDDVREKGKKKVFRLRQRWMFAWKNEKNQAPPPKFPMIPVSPFLANCASLMFNSNSYLPNLLTQRPQNETKKKRKIPHQKSYKTILRFSLEKDLDLDDEIFILYC